MCGGIEKSTFMNLLPILSETIQVIAYRPEKKMKMV